MIVSCILTSCLAFLAHVNFFLNEKLGGLSTESLCIKSGTNNKTALILQQNDDQAFLALINLMQQHCG